MRLEKLSPFDADTQRRTSEAAEAITIYPRYEGNRGDGKALLKSVESRASKRRSPSGRFHDLGPG
jgi:transcription-repair coupling factor (superfamily II helicase)